jgi:hypothetical protein
VGKDLGFEGFAVLEFHAIGASIGPGGYDPVELRADKVLIALSSPKSESVVPCSNQQSEPALIPPKTTPFAVGTKQTLGFFLAASLRR